MSIYATPTAVIAHFYHRAGLSILPLRLDGSKAPLIRWARENWHDLLWEEIAHWFNRPNPAGIGILCGERSGGLEVLDFDSPDAFPQWASLADASLVATLPLVATPSDGRHLYYRCATIEPSQVLSRDELGEVWIETRAEGAYIVAPGSPPSVHTTGKHYILLQGDPRNPPLITAEQRAGFLSAARELNRYAPQETAKPCRKIPRTQGRALVGDKFIQEASWESILEPLGWAIARTNGSKTYWTKPDAKRGEVHATTGHGVADCLYCFSTDCLPLEAGRSYNKFATYALLWHGGDFHKAARAIKQNKHFFGG